MNEAKIVRVFHSNTTKGSLIHGPVKLADGSITSYELKPGGHADVPEDVANIWLTHTHYGVPVANLSEGGAPVTPNDKVVAERDALANENKELTENTVKMLERMEALEKMLQEARKINEPRQIEGTSPSPEEIAAEKNVQVATPAPAEPAKAKATRGSKQI